LSFFSKQVTTVIWNFTDYGPNYTAFEGAYVDGGFTSGTPVKGSVLIIL